MSENVMKKKTEKKVLKKNPKKNIYSYALTCYTKYRSRVNFCCKTAFL